MMGSYAVNSGDALDRLANPLARAQALTRESVAHCIPTLSAEDSVHDGMAQRSAGHYLRLLVVDGRVVAAIEHRHGKKFDVGARKLKAERALAQRAAAALRLGLAVIDVARDADRPYVLGISATPALGVLERLTGARVAEAIIALIETRVRSWVRHSVPPAGPGAYGEEANPQT